MTDIPIFDELSGIDRIVNAIRRHPVALLVLLHAVSEFREHLFLSMDIIALLQ